MNSKKSRANSKYSWQVIENQCLSHILDFDRQHMGSIIGDRNVIFMGDSLQEEFAVSFAYAMLDGILE